MQLPLFVVVLILDFLRIEADERRWLDERRFGKYQDGWKSIGGEEGAVYYLFQTTYEDDIGSWGKKFKCVAVKTTNVNNANRTVDSHFYFKNQDTSGKVSEETEHVRAIKHKNYNKFYNQIEYILEKPRNLIDTVVYTDETCDLFYVSYANNNAGGFELWVNDKSVKSVPLHCTFILNVFAPDGSQIYNIYEKDECQDVEKLTGKQI